MSASIELSPAEQRRGRLCAIASHPFSMVYRMAIVGTLATQALVTLGASATAVGAHAGLVSFATLIQLPSLRLLSRIEKRQLLLWTQIAGLVTGLPLVAFGWLAGLDSGLAVPLALVSLALTTLALTSGSAAWWPLLHGFVPRSGTARFFAALRSLWHLTLIAFFLGSAWWLKEHPAHFGALFGVAWLCGLIRALTFLVFPERPEGHVEQPRDAFARMRSSPRLRRSLRGVTFDQIGYRALPPFAVLLLRREAGLSEAEVLGLTLSLYTGGLLALLPAGWLSDRVGPRPVLKASCWLRAAVVAGLAGSVLVCEGTSLLVVFCALFLAWAFLTSAFGVAEVKVLFQLAGDASPTGVIVTSVVIRSVVAGAVALAIGVGIDAALAAELLPNLSLYVGVFLVLATLQAGAALPLTRLDLAAEVSP